MASFMSLFQNSLNGPEMESANILEEAYNAPTKSKKIELARRALQVYPDNIDAELYIVSLEEDQVEKLSKIERVIGKAKTILENGNYFSKHVGHFWGLIETRPYMRARHKKLLLLMDLGRYSCALKESEELLRLCESDNLGIRYNLLGLYCYFEKFDECERLFSNYDESSLHLLLPMAIMNYKRGNYEKAKEILKEINSDNPHMKQQLKLRDKTSILEEAEHLESYSSGSRDEAILVIRELNYLLGSVPGFPAFVNKTFNGDQISF